MNRFLYFFPIASLPLLALAQQSSDDSMQTDNPYIASALIFIVALAVSVALISYFHLEKRGRLTVGIIFCIIGWMITAPINMSAGMNMYLSLAVATISAGLLALIIIRFGKNLASFFTRHNAERRYDDND